MKPVVTSEQMREIDKSAIDGLGIPGPALMENAGREAARVAESMLPERGKILVFCGRGNNGGDGMVAARHLANRGFDCRVYLTASEETLRGDAAQQLGILKKSNLPIVELNSRSLSAIEKGDLVIDALLGTGAKGEIEGMTAKAVRWIGAAGIPVLSLDIPTGVSGDDGSCANLFVRADQTVTFGLLKRGLVLHPGRDLAGRIIVADIGIPSNLIRQVNCPVQQVESKDAAGWLPPRPSDGHKGDFGRILVLAGSTGMTGAAVLSSTAVLMAGAGLVILGIPASLNPILEAKLTEVMTRPLNETASGSLALSSESKILELAEWADVVVIGPGLSTEPETTELVRRLVGRIRKPMVIDADALNAFDGKSDLLAGESFRVLTPHPGELSRLIDRPIEHINQNRIESALSAAKRFNAAVVLKGSPTITTDPSGRIFINATGNSGMATAGSGDVLAGLIGGLLPGGPSLERIAAGVHVHGLAGDIAAGAKTSRSLIAGDLLDFIPAAFRELEER